MVHSACSIAITIVVWSMSTTNIHGDNAGFQFNGSQLQNNQLNVYQATGPTPGDSIYVTLRPSLQEADFTTGCLQSLSFPEMSIRDDVRDAAPDTCQWFRQHEQYRRWCEVGGALILEGRPGSGKSTLMKHAVLAEADTDTERTLSFCFNRFGNEKQRNLSGFLRSMLYQILGRDPECLASFLRQTDFEQRCRREGDPGKGWSWSREQLQTQFEAQSAARSPVIGTRIFVDAFDECDSADRPWITGLLQSLCRPVSKNISVCISSRSIPKVNWPGSLRISTHGQNDADIERYTAQTLRQRVQDFGLENEESIQRAIVSRAQGVFKWVVLVLDRVVEEVTNMGSLIKTKDIIRHVNELPKELEEIYQSILSRLSRWQKELALRVFRWLALSPRTLSVAELRYAVAMGPAAQYRTVEALQDSDFWSASDEHMAALVHTISGGLTLMVEMYKSEDGMTHDARARRPRLPHMRGSFVASRESALLFDHASVKDYMCEQGLRYLEGALGLPAAGPIFGGASYHAMLHTCIRYMKLQEISSYATELTARETPQEPSSVIELPDEYVFARTAAKLWLHLAVLVEKRGIVHHDLVALTEWPSNTACMIFNVLSLPTLDLREGEAPSLDYWRTSLVHLASQHGIESVLAHLLPACPSMHTPQEILQRLNGHDWRHLTPACYAAAYGHTETVARLIAAGADITLSDDDDMTPLCFAAHSGHIAIVRLLLEAGSPVSSIQPDQDSAMHLAAKAGAWDVAKLLAQHAESVEELGEGDALIHIAARRNRTDFIRYLIEIHGVNVNMCNSNGESPLHLACGGDFPYAAASESVLKKRKGYPQRAIDVINNRARDKVDWARDKVNDNLPTLDFWGKYGDRSAMVRLLLDMPDIDVRLPDRWGDTPLHAAAEDWKVCLVEMLLHTGDVDVNAVNDDSRTALHTAFDPCDSRTSVANHALSLVVGCLLSAEDIEPDIWDTDGKTPLVKALQAMPSTDTERAAILLLETEKVDVNIRAPKLECELEGYSSDESEPDSDTTPFDMALMVGHTKVIEYLFTHPLIDIEPTEHEWYRTLGRETQGDRDMTDEEREMQSETTTGPGLVSRCLDALNELLGRSNHESSGV